LIECQSADLEVGSSG